MEVTRTSMIHAAAPHFLWPFAVGYAVHQLNLWPRVSLPETSPTLRWTGKVGYASVFRVWVLLPHLALCLPFSGITFDEWVLFYCLFPYCSAPPPPLPLFLAPGTPAVDPLCPQGPAPSALGAARGAASRGAEPGGAESEGAGSKGAELGGVEPGGAEPTGAEPAGVELGGAEPQGVEPGGAESEGAESGGAEPRGTASSGGPVGASPRLSPWPEPLSPQQLRMWISQRTRLRSGAAGAGDSAAGDTRAGGAGVIAGVGGTGGAAAAGPGVARTRGTGAGGTGSVGGAGAGGAGDPAEPGNAGAGAGNTGAVGAGVGGTGTGAGGARAGGAGAGDTGAVDPGAGGGCAGGRRVPRPRPPSIPGTHTIALRPSSVPVRPPLPAPPESSLPTVPDPESDLAVNPTATSLVAESNSDCPPSIGGDCSLGTDVPKDRQEEFECLAAAVPRFASMLLAPEGDPDVSDIPILCSYTEVFMAVGFTPSTADPSLFLRNDTAVPPFNVLVYVDDLIFATDDTQALTLVKSELQKRHTCTDLGPPALRLQVLFATAHSSVYRPLALSSTFGRVCRAEWSVPRACGLPHVLMMCTRPDLAYPLSLVACYVAPSRHRKVHWDAAKRVLCYLCSTSGMGLVLRGRGPVVLTGHADASWIDNLATQRSSQSYTFSLGSGSVSWRSTRSSLVLSSSCEAEIYAGTMAAQELR
ncbi:unnamed protein product [Closterium sp. NIES-53]